MSRYIAVYSESRVDAVELDAACKAIQKQLERHVEPEWGERTYVAYSPTASPAAGWERVGIYDELSYPNVNGYHAVQNEQPFALVRATDFWTLDLSHEILEMVSDPTGRGFRSGASLHPEQGSVSYLLEICDACQDFDDSYFVEEVRVCNFFKKHYFTPGFMTGVTYSMPNAQGQPVLTGPLEVRPHGYLTWFHEPTDQWWCGDRFDGSLNIKPIDPPTVHFSTLRAAVDTAMEERILTRRKALQAGGQARPEDFFNASVREARAARGAKLRDWLKRLSDEACVWHDKRAEIRQAAALLAERVPPPASGKVQKRRALRTKPFAAKPTEPLSAPKSTRSRKRR